MQHIKFSRLFTGIVFSIGLSFVAYGQINADSLFAPLDTIRNDSDKILYLNTISFDNTRRDPHVAMLLSDSARKLSLTENNQNGLFDSYLNTGTCYQYLSEHTKSICYFDSAKIIAQNLHDSVLLAKVFNNIGLSYRLKGDLDIALENFIESIEFLKNDSSSMASKLGNIATIYYLTNNFDKAIAVFKQIASIFTKEGKNRYLISTYYNLSMCYVELNEFELAKKYSLTGLEIANEVNDYRGQCAIYSSLGKQERLEGNFNKAKDYLQKSFRIASKVSDQTVLAAAGYELCLVYKDMDKNNEAIKYLLKSIEIAEELNSKIELEEYYKVISQLYKSIGNYEKSYNFLILKNSISDSLSNKWKIKQMAESQIKFETFKTEQQIRLLKDDNKTKQLEIKHKEQQRNWLIAFFIMLLIVLFIIIIYYGKLKVAKNKIEILQREIHHNVKNNLSIIARMIDVAKEKTGEHNKKDALVQLSNRVSSIAQIHAQLYHKDDIASVDVNKYISNLCDNIANTLQRKDLTIHQAIDGNINLDFKTSVPLGLIVNELLTNAHKYSYNPNAGTMVALEIRNEKKKIVVKVYDNGIGFPLDFDVNKINSYGLKLVNGLTQQLDGKIKYYNDPGATVEIEIPTNNNES